MTAPKSPIHAAALEYAARGWHVFPIEGARPGDPESGKRPYPGLYNGKDSATTDPRVIDLWWTNWPDANVGIACEPSGLVVLDVDTGPVKDKTGKVVGNKQGRESLAEFDAELPATLTALTGGGGLHALYTESEAAVQRLGFRPGLDLIGKGYIVAAPSKHYTGGEYRWHQIVRPVPLPAVLRNAKKGNAPAAPGEPEKVQSIERPKIGSGGRNIAMFRLGASMREKGLGREALAAAMHWENQQRCDPPIEDAELVELVDKIMRRVAIGFDVANGAVQAEELRQIIAPSPKEAAMWISEVSAEPVIPQFWYPTGFDQLDILLGGGVATRQVTGVIAPPSAGKSAFVGTIALTLQSTLPVLLYSTELPREEVFVRFAASRMGFAWREGLKGKVSRADMVAAVAGLRIKIIGSDDIDRNDPLGQLQRTIESIRAQFGVSPVVIVDYVQMLTRGAEDVRGKVGELTMGLRIISQVYDCVVLAVFSTGRAFYGDSAKVLQLREGNDPTAYLAAAKESGDIEFDCACMLYLDLDKMHEGQPKPARIAVARVRAGDVGFAGARAALDVGRWWGDASANTEMSIENQKETRHVATLERDQLRVLELIQRMPNRPWREIGLASGMGGKRADAARSKLIETGKLESVREVFYDAMQRRQTKDILRVSGGNTASLPSIPPIGAP